ncbi:ABC transporter substrate-binding protein [bacterium]|nr:ABC transporter substrate-binding protein [bacterium]
MTISPRRAFVPALVFTALVLLFTSCGQAPQPGDVTTDALTDDELALATRLYGRMQEEHAAERDRATLHLGYELMDRYAGFPRMDHVVEMATLSAHRLGETAEALRLSGEYLATYPDSPGAYGLLELRADLLEAAGHDVRAADALIQCHGKTRLAADRERIAERLAAVAGRLDADDLESLRVAHADSPLRPMLGFLWLQRLLAEERGREAGDLVDRMRTESPGDPWVSLAEQLLRDPDAGLPFITEPGIFEGDVDPMHLSVVCPLTGRYTVLGNAFYDGVRLARDRANREGWRQYTLSVHDSEGDPVAAAFAVRRTAQREKPMAVIGALLSAPTVSAALTAEQLGIPLISPTATNERIWELGGLIFQPNVTGLFEARLLARLVVQVLLKERIAVLYPDTPTGLRYYESFATEILDLGGKLVAAEPFNVGLTDFRDPLKKIGKALPEVIFVPADEGQIRMLGTQLDYYRTGALVVGLSDWDSAELAQEIGSTLERAVFPSHSALYPPAWPAGFDAEWNEEHLPPEATNIARQAYLATLLVLDTLGEQGMSRREDLAFALHERLENRSATEAATGYLFAALRMYRNGAVVPFPMDLYAEAMAEADSLAALEDTEPFIEHMLGPER